MSKSSNVVEMHESGMSWSDIAGVLGVTTDVAMAEYRKEKYDNWDIDWSFTPSNGGVGDFEAGAVRWENGTDSVCRVTIEEIANGKVPLSLSLEEEGAETGVLASLSPDEARELSTVLDECADIAEGKK